MNNDLDWSQIDQKKFFIYGTGVFTAVAGILYPFQVIKTRQMALVGDVTFLQGSQKTFMTIWKNEGVRGFYSGFAVSVFGAIPSRMIYLQTLEITKMVMQQQFSRQTDWSQSTIMGASSFTAGAIASISSQAVTVPVDVITQRQMLPSSSSANAASQIARKNGLRMAMHIINTEGVLGLYRGITMSIFTYTPSSAVWWSCYGFYKSLLTQVAWPQDQSQPAQHSTSQTASLVDSGSMQQAQQQQSMATASLGDIENMSYSDIGKVVGVQVSSTVLSGFTAATLTNPLDVVKTRMQTAAHSDATARPTISQVLRQLIKQDGFVGLFRGLAPRMAGSALFGTGMVSAYEILKRACAIEQ